MAEHRDPEDTESKRTDLTEADGLLQRTRTFLERCSEEPETAFEGEDPDDLRHRLHGLTHPALEPVEGDEEDDPPVERRRSA